jgi:transposase
VPTKAELQQQLRERDAALAAQSVALEAAYVRIAELETRLAKLEELLMRSSQNSSLPPSKNPLHVKRGRKSAPTGNSVGGQTGHKPHLFAAVEPDEVTRTEMCRPAGNCDYCLADLADAPLVLGENALPFYRFDLPDLKLDVTAYIRPRR